MKMFFFVALAALVASCWAVPAPQNAMPSLFQFPASWETNEIDQTPPYTKEKRLALQTNEIEPSDAATAATTQALDYSDSEEEWEVETTQAQPDTTQVAAFINPSKAPVTVMEHVREFLYGLGYWFYSKLIAG